MLPCTCLTPHFLLVWCRELHTFPFSLAQGMAKRKPTIFAIDQADTWSWVASSMAHYGSVIIFSTKSPLLYSSQELHVLTLGLLGA